jgi:hypothetical protein
MKNIDQNISELKKLTINECCTINGGDGITEAFFYALGFFSTKVALSKSKIRSGGNILPAGVGIL